MTPSKSMTAEEQDEPQMLHRGPATKDQDETVDAAEVRWPRSRTIRSVLSKSTATKEQAHPAAKEKD